jgi:hypothetical protein
MTGWFEITPGGGRQPLNLKGRYVGRDGSGSPIYEDATVSGVPDTFDANDYLPIAPTIAVTQTARTSADITITPSPLNPPPRGPLLTYRVFRSDNGGTFSLVAEITADNDAPVVYTNSSLPTATPEITFQWKVVPTNGDGIGPSSNTVTAQWSGTAPTQQPTAPTALTVSNIGQTGAHLTWAETTDATVTKHGLFLGATATTPLVDNISASAKAYDLANIDPGTTYTNLVVRRYNGVASSAPSGWSPASNPVTFKTLTNAGGPLFLGHQRGKVAIGWSTLASFTTAENQLDTQTPFNATAGAPSGVSYSSQMGVYRQFGYDSGNFADADSKNRIVWVSAKPADWGAGNSDETGWTAVAGGTHDAAIISWFTPIINRNKLTIFTFNHEPIGNSVGDPNAAGDAHCAAWRHIIQLVDNHTGWSNHRVIWAPLYEENRLRNIKKNNIGIDWSRWLPEDLLPGRSSVAWDFIGFDFYQDTIMGSASLWSSRWTRIHDMFTGKFRTTYTTAMPYMTFTPGVDIVFGIGEASARPGLFYEFQNPTFTEPTGSHLHRESDITGAKYFRDMKNHIFSNLDQFFAWCTFNSIGADNVFNDERLWPGTNTWNKAPGHPDFTQQTGDTEYTINIYREMLNSGKTVKLGPDGLPA